MVAMVGVAIAVAILAVGAIVVVAGVVVSTIARPKSAIIITHALRCTIIKQERLR